MTKQSFLCMLKTETSASNNFMRTIAEREREKAFNVATLPTYTIHQRGGENKRSKEKNMASVAI